MISAVIGLPLPDAWEILQNLKQIDREEQRLSARIYDMYSQLTGKPGDMKVAEEHKNLIRSRQEMKKWLHFPRKYLPCMWKAGVLQSLADRF